MTGWTTHAGRAAGLALESIDTDQLIPARFMATPRDQGYGRFLLHDMRFGADGRPRPTPLRDDTSVLVARRNFGSGSSREAAVYALVDYGIRAVIAPGFGDIFASNAVNNGLLPARIPDTAVEAMLARLADADAEARIDLTAGTLRVAGIEARFDLPESWKVKLINGWDDIDLTLQHRDRIAAFARSYQDDPAHRPEN
ncbi:3-isopropylmalate dehydratase small subunit [Paracoccus sp. (in: a-proteobacteria)]|uniref:3-isopropylmalate dehydratase small subunit n=1 Tax=Paracoccus sp. TaxID=267 RepID=UPI003A85E042